MPGQSVTIGIPEDVIVKGSLLVYLVPVVSSVIGAWLAGPQGELQSMLGAFCGLLLGGVLVNLQSQKLRNDLRLNPVLLSDLGEKQALDFQ